MRLLRCYFEVVGLLLCDCWGVLSGCNAVAMWLLGFYFCDCWAVAM